MSLTPLTTRHVNLTTADWELIGAYAHARRLGQGGFSAALRSILHEWSRMRSAYEAMPYEQRLCLGTDFEPIEELVTPEDVILESRPVDVEVPASTSHPSLPQDEYEAALARMRLDKFTNPSALTSKPS